VSGSLYPVTLDVAGRPCLVVGGGRVATRKVNGLLACGAVVTVVAPEVVAELAERVTNAEPGFLSITYRPYEAGEVRHYQLVLTATGLAAVDGAVARDCAAPAR
jgi:precorrin-2 dehydrogenase / sirohydrochlorin ferrochelatase